MFREITLGQYYPVDSAVHRLDPRTKLFGTMVFIASLFVPDRRTHTGKVLDFQDNL